MFVKIGRINKPIFYYCYIHKKCKKKHYINIANFNYKVQNCKLHAK